MVYQIAYTQFLGLPIIAYGGITTLLLFFLVAFIGYCKFHGKLPKLSFYWHPALAVLALISGLLHGLMGLSVYLGF